MKAKILFLCPIPPPLGGQAIMSLITAEIIEPDYIINTNINRSFFKNLRVLFLIIHYLFTKNIKIVYFTCSRSKIGAIRDILLLFLSGLKGIRVINHLHGSEINDILTPHLFKLILEKAYSFIDTTIFVTQSQCDSFPIALPNMKKFVIPNCYNIEFDKISWRDKNVCSENNVVNILFISLLMESKGIIHALKVFEMVARQVPNVNFNIVGDFRGDYLKSEMEIKRDFFKIWSNLVIEFKGRFFFHGPLSGISKVYIYLKSDILFFPTFFKSESFGIVIIEAMRTGNVVIASNLDFISDLVDSERGKLINPFDICDGVEAIKYYIANPMEMRRIQENNLLWSSEKFSKDIYANLIKDLFKN